MLAVDNFNTEFIFSCIFCKCREISMLVQNVRMRKSIYIYVSAL